jgi:hypothetical protein
LFTFYLITIGFIFASAIVKRIPEPKIWNWLPTFIYWLYLFFGSTSFLLSFGLPYSLRKIQLERFENEEQRRLANAADEAKIRDQ